MMVKSAHWLERKENQTELSRLYHTRSTVIICKLSVEADVFQEEIDSEIVGNVHELF